MKKESGTGQRIKSHAFRLQMTFDFPTHIRGLYNSLDLYIGENYGFLTTIFDKNNNAIFNIHSNAMVELCIRVDSHVMKKILQVK